MSPTQSHPEGEIVPPEGSGVPTGEYAPAEAYSPEQARRRSEYGVWDPRSAPGTYLLLAINIGVYLWMVTHGVSPKDPSEGDLLRYGANVTWLVLHGQWYRLLTATRSEEHTSELQSHHDLVCRLLLEKKKTKKKKKKIKKKKKKKQQKN